MSCCIWLLLCFLSLLSAFCHDYCSRLPLSFSNTVPHACPWPLEAVLNSVSRSHQVLSLMPSPIRAVLLVCLLLGEGGALFLPALVCATEIDPIPPPQEQYLVH